MAKKIITIVFIFLISGLNIVKADWPIGKKRFNLSPSFSYYSTPRYFDGNGNIRLSDNNGTYRTQNIGLYGIGGLSRRVDFYFNVPFTRIVSSDIFTTAAKMGVGDVIAGIALHTPSADLKSYFTAKAQLMIPMYSNVTSPYLGYGSKGVQLAANYSFLPSTGHFIVTEVTAARYFDQVEGPTQLGLAVSYGVQLPKFQSLAFTYNHLNSISSNKIFTPNFNSNKDFMLGRLSASYGKRISRTVTPNVQTSYSIYGRNVGQGFSFSLFLSIRLP